MDDCVVAQHQNRQVLLIFWLSHIDRRFGTHDVSQNAYHCILVTVSRNMENLLYLLNHACNCQALIGWGYRDIAQHSVQGVVFNSRIQSQDNGSNLCMIHWRERNIH